MLETQFFANFIYFCSHLKMTSTGPKHHDFLPSVFIAKPIIIIGDKLQKKINKLEENEPHILKIKKLNEVKN